MVGANIVTKHFAKAIGAVGIAMGLVFQGRSMTFSVQAIFPLGNALVTAEVLFVTVGAFLFAKAVRAPLSLSMAVVALLLGLSTSHNLAVSYLYTIKVVGMWVAAPIIGVAFGFLFLRLIDKVKFGNVWRRVAVYKISLIAFSFLAAFVLGANTIGLIVALGGFAADSVLGAVVAIALGCAFLSEGEIKRVGQDLFSLRYPNALASLIVATILVEFATLWALPLSSTQALAASVVGAGVSSGNKLISLRPFLIIVVAWVLVPLLCFSLGYVL
jgi:PiT family inorganic phosphate transporter